MNYIYLPVDNVSDFACYSVRDKDTIRAYKQMPTVNSTIDYIDFYINSHYLENSGQQTFSQYTNYLPTCLADNSITNEVYYRTDFADTLIIFVLIIFICIWCPLKLTFGRMFKRFMK